MPEEYRSFGTGLVIGTRMEDRREGSRGLPRWVVAVLAVLLVVLQAACAAGYPMVGEMAGNHHHRPVTVPARPDAKERGATERAVAEGPSAARGSVGASVEARVARGGGDGGSAGGAGSRTRSQARLAGEADEAEDWEGAEAGWPDGVGDGRPHTVPITLDYFQGFLVQAGVASTALPVDGRTLSPQQAMELLPHLLSTPVTLGNFGIRRMAAHLLLEVATSATAVSRDELHARMRRFSRLLVLRPDGYLVKSTTGVAVQKAGQVVLADDGTLRAGHFEVGPFYAIDGGRLFPVDEKLEVLHGARPAGIYEPDDGVLLPVAEGAVLAVVDTVEGIYRLVFYTGETLEGLAQLPGAVRELYENAPGLWEEFRHKPYAERVRTVSRLATSIVLMVGTSGAGAAKAASWGGRLGSISVPLLSLSGDGLLAMRLVAVPAGGVVAVAGSALSATYVLHMANVGAQGSRGGGGWPPVGGPGHWVEDTSSMSEQSRSYQAQVTGAPKRWAYRVCRDGECVDYDGFDPKTDMLLEAKSRGYDKWFDQDLKVRWKYEGADDMVKQARRQSRLAGGLRVRWHVAEARMVAVLKKLFKESNIEGIEIVHTPPLPRD
ncbi:restriction endonuclease fold toxin 5 domain-containing protein [Vitiosangium sp. GDMCC 1.1324]|uniref:restriction endonuclease fold toxin 5 domain-containing protein n=1 Tax=Vitiosangium sp. (strain GDMCC 1.1324) TaxID=2138576 RepID=UPI00130E1C40|nr:restriction endonuclease fold toxin 5 domain-containing protein [Vitiosangium sp. GDMCC 1.1324]